MLAQRTTAVLAFIFVFAGAAWAQDDNPEPAGFTPLFNGKDLAGWKGGSTVEPDKITQEQQAEWDADVPNHWSVDGDELVNDGKEPHLATAKDYGDFEMWVDWKLSPKGDSGIYLRDCPQVQLWDPQNKAAHKSGSDKGSGALWNNKEHGKFPPEVADKPTGEWNRMYIRMVGPYVKVMLNDKVTVDNVALENYYNREAPVPARGAIHLQTHGSETRFRNLYIRETPAEEADKRLSEIRGGEEDFEPAFNGKDFSGWIGAIADHEIVDGAIRVKPDRGGNLLTQREYGDFIARLEFKLPPGGNNGLAIRSPGPEANAAYEGLELQVLDDGHEKYADLEPYQVHGSIYGVMPAHRGYLRPTGEWNYQEVVVDGEHVEVHLNGFKILDANLADVRDKPADGEQHPGLARTTGHFGFCGHNDPVEFRNIRIKSLD
jgi:hypothetical protein